MGNTSVLLVGANSSKQINVDANNAYFHNSTLGLACGDVYRKFLQYLLQLQPSLLAPTTQMVFRT